MKLYVLNLVWNYVMQFLGSMSEGSAKVALTNVAAGSSAQQMRFLASQLAREGISCLGQKLTQKMVKKGLSAMAHKVLYCLHYCKSCFID